MIKHLIFIAFLSVLFVVQLVLFNHVIADEMQEFELADGVKMNKVEQPKVETELIEKQVLENQELKNQEIGESKKLALQTGSKSLSINKASNSDSADQAVPSPPMSPLASSGKVVLALVFVVFIIFVLAYFFRRYQQYLPNQNQAIQVLANQPVGVKEKVALIQVGQQQVLIGITSQAINPILILDDDKQIPTPGSKAAADNTQQNNQAAASMDSFPDILRKALMK